MARRTIEVAKLRDKVNEMIAYSHEHHRTTAKQNRYALGTLLENVLMETGNYQGFRYLEDPEVVDYDKSARKYY